MEVYERVLEYVTRMRGQTEREKNKLTCQLEFLKQWDAQLFELPFADLWLKPADGSPCVAANRTILVRFQQQALTGASNFVKFCWFLSTPSG